MTEAATRPRLQHARLLFPEHLQVNRAHVVMLIEQGIVTLEQGRTLLDLLGEIESLGPEQFPMDPAAGPFIEQLERYMSGRAGEDIAGRLHTGRSYLDYDAAVTRLFARNRLLKVMDRLLALQQTLLDVAEQHTLTIMPGYTDLQHAQPWTFGHYLLRHVAALDRDVERLEGAFARTNQSSLGGAALVGTSWPLDRPRVAVLLGHAGIVRHAHDAGELTPDVLLENVSVLSILMSNLARLAGDLYVWSSQEFGFVELADEYAGTSSIMPQKKNPYALGVVKGLAGQAIGWMPWMQGIFKGATSTDLDYPYVGDLLDQATGSPVAAAGLMEGVIRTLTVNVERMRERVVTSWSGAGHLADEIVRQAGLSFRSAHRIVGQLVRDTIDAGIPPHDVTAAMLDDAAVRVAGGTLGLTDAVISAALNPLRFIETRTTPGSVHPDEVRRMAADARVRLQIHRADHTATVAGTEGARAGLDRRVRELLQPP